MTMAEPVTKQQNQRNIIIDEIDKQILNLLIANARDSTRTIVKKMADIGTNMSERGIGKRIARLERLGVIHGYTTMVDLNQVNMPILRLGNCKIYITKRLCIKTRGDERISYQCAIL